MKLFQHADFDQAIIRAAEHFKPQGLRPSMIEKDYYVTEVVTPHIVCPCQSFHLSD